MMASPKTPVRYKLAKPIQAVKLQTHQGSSLRDPTGELIEIPVNAIIEPEGQVDPSGLVNVLWNGGAFSVFYEDLVEKANIIT
jgi:hypothetical protein